MRTVTACKPFEEVQGLLKSLNKIYLIGCGTCCTELKTGGKEEVLAMKQKLESIGKAVTGWMVVPAPCDELTKDALIQEKKPIDAADAILVLACGFGVQTVSGNTIKPVVPALDTLYVGKDYDGGLIAEICKQCGQCVLGLTAGICPITTCHKGLLNGPCGGTNKGKCEVDKDKDCAWALIYKKLKEQDRLDLLDNIQPPKNYNVIKHPGKLQVKR